jgi:uncharacterized RDD family membrane protein YckC
MLLAWHTHPEAIAASHGRHFVTTLQALCRAIAGVAWLETIGKLGALRVAIFPFLELMLLCCIFE